MLADKLKAFSENYCCDAYEFLGSHNIDGKTVFRVWAPNAKGVSVVGDFCDWEPKRYNMFHIGGGVFEAIVDELPEFTAYKYAVQKKRTIINLAEDTVLCCIDGDNQRYSS